MSDILPTIRASVASNALTITVAAPDGSLSAPGQLSFSFRHPTLNNGNVVQRFAIDTLTLTISSGSTMGVPSGTPCRIWLALFDDDGVLRLAARVCSTAVALFPLVEVGVASSIAEGGAGAADSAGVFYSDAAVSSKAFRVLGFLTWNSGLSVAGTWDAAPDVIEPFTPGTPLPGHEVQSVVVVDATYRTITTTLPYDDTIPQNTEGEEIFTNTITPISPVDFVMNESVLCCGAAAAMPVAAALFKDSVADALAACASYVADGATPAQLVLKDFRKLNTASAVTYKIRAGASGGNFHLNGDGAVGSFKLGGTQRSFLRTAEIMG